MNHHGQFHENASLQGSPQFHHHTTSDGKYKSARGSKPSRSQNTWGWFSDKSCTRDDVKSRLITIILCGHHARYKSRIRALVRAVQLSHCYIHTVTVWFFTFYARFRILLASLSLYFSMCQSFKRRDRDFWRRNFANYKSFCRQIEM